MNVEDYITNFFDSWQSKYQEFIIIYKLLFNQLNYILFHDQLTIFFYAINGLSSHI